MGDSNCVINPSLSHAQKLPLANHGLANVTRHGLGLCMDCANLIPVILKVWMGEWFFFFPLRKS